MRPGNFGVVLGWWPDVGWLSVLRRLDVGPVRRGHRDVVHRRRPEVDGLEVLRRPDLPAMRRGHVDVVHRHRTGVDRLPLLRHQRVLTVRRRYVDLVHGHRPEVDGRCLLSALVDDVRGRHRVRLPRKVDRLVVLHLISSRRRVALDVGRWVCGLALCAIRPGHLVAHSLRATAEPANRLVVHPVACCD